MNLLHSHVAATCLKKNKPENVYPKNERKKKKTKLFHKLHSTHNIIMTFQKYTSVALLLIK